MELPAFVDTAGPNLRDTDCTGELQCSDTTAFSEGRGSSGNDCVTHFKVLVLLFCQSPLRHHKGPQPLACHVSTLQEKELLSVAPRVPELTAIRPQGPSGLLPSSAASCSHFPAGPLWKHSNLKSHRPQQSWAKKDRRSPGKLEETCGRCLQVLYHCVPPAGEPHHNCPTEGWGREMTGI